MPPKEMGTRTPHLNTPNMLLKCFVSLEVYTGKRVPNIRSLECRLFFGESTPYERSTCWGSVSVWMVVISEAQRERYIYIYTYSCGVIIWSKFCFVIVIIWSKVLVSRHCLSQNTIKYGFQHIFWTKLRALISIVIIWSQLAFFFVPRTWTR